MTEGVAINVLPGPGSYRCRWQLPPDFGSENVNAENLTSAVNEPPRKFRLWQWPRKRRQQRRTRRNRDHPAVADSLEVPVSYAGRIEILSGKAPKGELYDWIPRASIINTATMEMQLDSPQSFQRATLRGYLEDASFEVCLLDVTLNMWVPGQVEIRAAAALVGADLPSDDNLRFFGLAFQVSGIDAIGGSSPLLRPKNLPGATDYRSWEWEAKGNGASTQVWSDAGATLTHEFDISASVFDLYHFRVGFTPVVRLELLEAITLRELLDTWVEPLQRITSVATGREETITYLALQQEQRAERKPGSRIQVFGTGITQEPFSSRKSAMARSVFTTAIDDLSLLKMIRTWRHQVDDNNPIFETYNPVMLRRDQHPRSRYLLLIQCLEGLYGYQTRSKFEERNRIHLEKREQLIRRLEMLVADDTVELEKVDLKFAKERISKRPPESLDKALRTLFSQVKAEALLEELSGTALIKRVDAEKDLGGKVDDALAKIRNDLAHGNRGYLAHELIEVVRILERVTRAQMLSTLGCSEEVQRRAVYPY